jgi:hypothetical protein
LDRSFSSIGGIISYGGKVSVFMYRMKMAKKMFSVFLSLSRWETCPYHETVENVASLFKEQQGGMK